VLANRHYSILNFISGFALYLLCANASAADIVINIKRDFNDLKIYAEASTLGSNSAVVLKLTNYDPVEVECTATFNSKLAQSKGYKRSIAPQKRSTIRYNASRKTNRLTIHVKCLSIEVANPDIPDQS
jgi:hypothetical protein